jgi:hypothetical protein
MGEIAKMIAKIEASKVTAKDHPKDEQWLDGFNHGLDWAVRILNKDKSAY